MKKFIETTKTTIEEDGVAITVPNLNGFEKSGDVQYSVYDKEQSGSTGFLARVTATPEVMNEILLFDEVTELSDDDVITDSDNPIGSGTNGLESLDHPDIEVDKILNNYTIKDILTTEDRYVANIVLNWSKLDGSSKVIILSEYDSSNPRDLVEDVSSDNLKDIVDGYEQFSGIPDDIETSTAARLVTQRGSSGRHTLQDQELTALDKCAIANDCESSKEVPTSTRGESYKDMSECACEIVDGRTNAHQEMLDYIKGDSSPPWK